ncbi:hypothetical protein L3Q67_26270 [Saccharothrix sp. AJ9571]|nr:hypothetical protein L3Q67_26270 [Saccharothrix sp. AJ9571]
MDLKERAAAATSAGHPDLGIRLTNLASAYSQRFQRTGELADADLAVEAGRRAVAAIPADHPCWLTAPPPDAILSDLIAQAAAEVRSGHTASPTAAEQGIGLFPSSTIKAKPTW